ncbi:hypothetical protein ElyMa_004790600 [Elysia marginata]|uniref:Uncharacterized protein n=1 Tax=Elysia marginata TaxID=1093978 RepID=A0AAV4IIL4_9GAST|nr:hypothetical protein ElyMa_004790600 [Elysia marginata]
MRDGDSCELKDSDSGEWRNGHNNRLKDDDCSGELTNSGSGELTNSGSGELTNSGSGELTNSGSGELRNDDSGEEVSYGREENPDILMRLALGSTLRSLTPKSRQAALDAANLVGVPSTHELLASTNSSRDNGKQRKRKGGKAQKLSPNRHGLTALASSVSNLDFLKFYRAHHAESGGEEQESRCAADVRDLKNAAHGRHSDEIVYASPSHNAADAVAATRGHHPLQRKGSSSVPRLDKVTQTSRDSRSNLNASARSGQSCGDDHPGAGFPELLSYERCSSSGDLFRNHARGSNVACSRSHTCLFRDEQMVKTQDFKKCSCDNFSDPFSSKYVLSSQCLSPNDINTHALLCSKQSRLFTVRQLYVESTDDDEDDTDDSDSSSRNSDIEKSSCDLGKEDLFNIHKQSTIATLDFEPDILCDKSRHLKKVPPILNQCNVDKKGLSSGNTSAGGVQDVFPRRDPAEIETNDTLRTSIPRRHQRCSKSRTAQSEETDNISCLLSHRVPSGGDAKPDPEVTSFRSCFSNEKEYAGSPSSLFPTQQQPTQNNVTHPDSEPTRFKPQNAIYSRTGTAQDTVLTNGDVGINVNIQPSECSTPEPKENFPSSQSSIDISNRANNSHTSGLSLDLINKTSTSSPSSSKPPSNHDSPFFTSPLTQQDRKPPATLPPPPPTPPLRKGRCISRMHKIKPNQSVFSFETSKTGHVPLIDLSKKLNHVHPTGKTRHADTQFLRETSPTSVTKKPKEAGNLDSVEDQGERYEQKAAKKSSPVGIVRTSMSGRTTKQVIGAERTKRIKKLQQDLVRISKELQDLNDVGSDVSEV